LSFQMYKSIKSIIIIIIFWNRFQLDERERERRMGDDTNNKKK